MHLFTTLACSQTQTLMWNRQTVSGDPDTDFNGRSGHRGSCCSSSPPWWAGVPSIFTLGSSTSLRSVLTPHWVIPQCIQTDDRENWSHTMDVAVLERSRLDPFNQRGYKSQRSIWQHGTKTPIKIKEKPAERPSQDLWWLLYVVVSMNHPSVWHLHCAPILFWLVNIQ